MPINQLKTVISLLNNGEIEEALSVAEEIIDLKYRDSAFAFIAEDYRANKNYEQFVNIVKRINNTDKKMDLILLCVKKIEQKEIGSDLLNEAYTILRPYPVNNIEYEELDKIYDFISDIVEQYARIGNYKHSLQITALVNDKESKLSLMIKIVRQLNQKDVAADLLNQIYAMLRQIKTNEIKDRFLTMIAEEYPIIGDYEKAFEIFGKLSQKTEVGVSRYLKSILTPAKNNIDSTFFKNARKCVESRKKSESKDYWAYLIIKEVSQTVDIEHVFQFIDSIQTDSLKEYPFCNIVRNHTNRADFNQSLKAIDNITDIYTRTETLIEIADFFLKIAKQSQALKLLAKTYRILISDKNSNRETYRRLSYSYESAKLPKMVNHINKVICDLEEPKKFYAQATVLGIGKKGGDAVQYIMNRKDEIYKSLCQHTYFYTIDTNSNTINTVDNSDIISGFMFSKEYNERYIYPKSALFSFENIELLINTPMLFIATDYKTVNEGEMIFNILEVAQKKGAVSFVIVNIDTDSNQTIYKAQQNQSMKKLHQIADTLVLIPDNLQMSCNIQDKENINYCGKYEQIFSHALLCISGSYLSIVGLDFADIRHGLGGKGLGALGSGLSKGKGKERTAVFEAISGLSASTELSASTIMDNAAAILWMIHSGNNDISDVIEISDLLHEMVSQDCEIVWGFIPDETSDIFQITILAAGLGDLCQYPAKEASKATLINYQQRR